MRRVVRSVAGVLLVAGLLLQGFVIGVPGAAAASTGSITGLVTAAATGAPIGGICASLYTTAGARTSDPQACSNAQGQYRMSVAKAGWYDVRFSDVTGTYATQWYANQPTQATANVVQVRWGRTTPNVNAAMVATSTLVAPAVGGLSPTSGPSAGGTSVTISGTNLGGATAVHFGTAAASISTDSASQIVALAPAGSAGTVDVTVTTAAGTSPVVAADQYTYTAVASPPAISGLSPTSGPTAGGTSVTISGTNLGGATAVHFGTAAASISTESASQIVALAPAGSAGTVDVTVTTSAGTSAVVAADRFTYQSSTSNATITAVGALVTHTNQPSQASETVSVSPAAVGDVLAVAIETKFPAGVPSFTAASISGGGVTTWTRVRAYFTGDGIHDEELWYGVVTTPGPSTVTVTYTSGSTSGNSESATSVDIQEFRSSSGASTSWSVDVSGILDTGIATNAPAYPTLSPAASGEAYFGYLAVPGAVGPGSTTGVVYQTDARGNQSAYDQAVASTISPVASSSSSQTFFSIGMLLTAH